jgi:pimeloyl-ACP methyl ester carboxylesterase
MLAVAALAPVARGAGISPPGANDPGCRPPAVHPYPVVLVHGTFADMGTEWDLIAPALERAGYCVFALDYGARGTRPIPESAVELAGFVRTVLAWTGARKVDLVGHSQGGMMPRWYVRFLGGNRYVDELVALAPTNEGSTVASAPAVARALHCAACAEQVAGSAVLRRLNAGDPTPGPTDYTVLETQLDQVVVPFRNAFLGPAPNVTNILLQTGCPYDLANHVSIAYDPVAVQWIENALARRGPADPMFAPDCLGLTAL